MDTLILEDLKKLIQQLEQNQLRTLRQLKLIGELLQKKKEKR